MYPSPSPGVLTANPTKRVFKQHEKIPLHDEYLWKIEQGSIRTMTWSKEGTLVTLGLWGPGDVIGRPLSKINPYLIQTLEPVEVVAVPRHHWNQELDAILLHTQYVEELLTIIHNETTYLRLLEFLIWLANRFSFEVEAGRLISLQLTHQEIAEIISSTRVSVTRTFGILKQEGKLLVNNKKLILPHSVNCSNTIAVERGRPDRSYWTEGEL
jgi:CRP-like cAMP-binding protein